jgi:DNA end-binding protein Ku
MTVLNFAAEVKEPASFLDEIVKAASSKQELQLTNQLIEGLTADKFDLKEYHDVYTEKLTQLIEAKVEGKEVVAPPAGEEPHVINLMESSRALNRSSRRRRPKSLRGRWRAARWRARSRQPARPRRGSGSPADFGQTK